MKRLNATFEIENDLAEDKLRTILEGLGAKYVKTLPNADHLKDDAFYIKLRKARKTNDNHLYDYIMKTQPNE
jgi:hypothetical protein